MNNIIEVNNLSKEWSAKESDYKAIIEKQTLEIDKLKEENSILKRDLK